MMGDIQQRSSSATCALYSVCDLRLHIAEAGANPVTQLALTVAKRFTYVEVLPRPGHGDRRPRAQPVVFFSNGMDPEYS